MRHDDDATRDEEQAKRLAALLVAEWRRVQDVDLRALPLTEVKALRSDPLIGDRLRRAIDRELGERLQGQDLECPEDEQL